MFFSYTYQEVEQNRIFYLQMYDPSHQLVQIDRTVDWNQLYNQLKRVLP